MLITSEQLNSLYEISCLDILDNSVYLTESESVLNPVAVPILENTRLGVNTVYYKDIQEICEDYGCYPYEALINIAESSNVNEDSIYVSIDESDVILNPEVVKEFPNYVIIPESNNSIASIFVDACLENYIYSLDEDYLYLMCTPEVFLEKSGIPNFIANNYFYNPHNNQVIDRRSGDVVTGLSNKQLNAVKNNKERNSASNNGSGSFFDQADPETIKKYEESKKTSADKDTDSLFNNTKNQEDIENKKQNVENTAETNSANNNNNNNNNTSGNNNSANNNNNSSGNNNSANNNNTSINAPEPIKNGLNPQNPSFMTQLSRLVLNKPRDFIAKMAAKLRMSYRIWMRKAKEEEKTGKAPWYKKIARKIMQAIDYLLKKVQNIRSEGYGKKVNDPLYYQPGHGRRTANRA